MSVFSLLHALHVVANLVWVGSILSVALVLAKGGGEPTVRGATALTLYRTLAVPSFVLSLLLGLVVLGSNTTYYLKSTHFMHAKLLFAFGVIAIHHVLGARARKMAAGTVADAGPAVILGGGLFALAVGASVLAVLKPF